jgi:ABC-type multidrug transport system fused ATPase/permease subunit
MFSRNKKDLKEASKPKVSRESFKEALKIFKFIRPYRGAFIGGMILLTLSSSLFMVFPYLAGLMVDIAEGKSELEYSLLQIGLGLLVLLLIQGAISFSRVILFAIVSENGIADIRKALYQKLISFPITFFEENKSGDLISRLTADVEKLYSTFSIALAEFLRQVIILVSGIIFLGILSPRLSLIMLLTFPGVVIIAIFFGRFIRKLSKKRQEELAASNSLLSESIQTIMVVKAFTSEIFEVNKYNKSISNVVKVALKYARSRAGFAVFIVTVMFGAIFFIIWQGAMMVQNGLMTSGDLVAFVSYTAIIGAAIGGLGNFTPELLGAIGATERVREILATESEVDLEGLPPIQVKPIEGNISLHDVYFRYPTRTDIEVLGGINMEIKAGQKVALVGPSGAGKSTIIQLLLRFYNIESGDIKVDGQSIYDSNIRDYRHNLALVPQEVILFGGTIRENILYGREDATEAEIMAAAEQSNSWEFISKFPEGLDTIVGERGVKLSGGQRQRIAIARAILKDPKILLLDEATSSLDAESEKVVQDALEKLMEGRTSIIIAHRLSTIRDVDQIYVLDQGKIAETGTHEELFEQEEGLYRSQALLGGIG